MHLQQVIALQMLCQHSLLEQYRRTPTKSATSLIIDKVVTVLICKLKKLNSAPLSSRPPKFSLVTLESRIPAPSKVCLTVPLSRITSLPCGFTILSTCWTVLWKGLGIPLGKNSIRFTVLGNTISWLLVTPWGVLPLYKHF